MKPTRGNGEQSLGLLPVITLGLTSSPECPHAETHITRCRQAYPYETNPGPHCPCISTPETITKCPILIKCQAIVLHTRGLFPRNVLRGIETKECLRRPPAINAKPSRYYRYHRVAATNLLFTDRYLNACLPWFWCMHHTHENPPATHGISNPT